MRKFSNQIEMLDNEKSSIQIEMLDNEKYIVHADNWQWTTPRFYRHYVTIIPAFVIRHRSYHASVVNMEDQYM